MRLIALLCIAGALFAQLDEKDGLAIDGFPDRLLSMAQHAVIGYSVTVSTAVAAGPNAPPIDYVPKLFVTAVTGNGMQQIELPMKSKEEFTAICALIQLPGRLVYEETQGTLEKIWP
jgi:hypothetical protein